MTPLAHRRRVRVRALPLACAATLATAVLASAGAAAAGQAGSLLVNGDFEGGLQTVTAGDFTNTLVPTGWTPTDGFVMEPAFDGVISNVTRSGQGALSIGNPLNEPIAGLTQVIDDIVGEVYRISFWTGAITTGDGTDPGGDLLLTVGLNAGAQVHQDATPFRFTRTTFTFTGAGHDEVFLRAATNSGRILIDDITITDTGRGPGSATPEPSAWSLMIAGFGLAGAGLRARRRRLA